MKWEDYFKGRGVESHSEKKGGNDGVRDIGFGGEGVGCFRGDGRLGN